MGHCIAEPVVMDLLFMDKKFLIIDHRVANQYIGVAT